MDEKPFNTDAYKSAWDWFSVHAAQRMEIFRFFILLTAALAAGYVGALQYKGYLLAVAIAGAGVFVSSTCKLLDRRVAALLKIAEGALEFEQGRLKSISGNPQIEFVKRADELALSQSTFRVLFGRMFSCAQALFVVGVAGATVPLLAPYIERLCGST